MNVFCFRVLFNTPHISYNSNVILHAVSSINAPNLDDDGIYLWRVKGPLKIDYSSCSSNCEHRSHLSCVLLLLRHRSINENEISYFECTKRYWHCTSYHNAENVQQLNIICACAQSCVRTMHTHAHPQLHATMERHLLRCILLALTNFR